MKSASLKFYDFQPLDIKSGLLVDLYAKNALFNDSVELYFHQHDQCEWIGEFCNNNDSLKNLKVSEIPISTSSLLILTDDLRLNMGCNDESILVNGASAKLIFDNKFVFFMVCIEVDILVNFEENDFSWIEKTNFYSAVRGLLVKDGKSKYKVSAVAQAIFDGAISVVKNMLSSMLKEVKDDCVTILDNTGNILCVYCDENNGMDDPSSLSHCLVQENFESERLVAVCDPIYLNGFDAADGELYFNGRMHTLNLVYAEDRVRYIPVFYMMQFTWFYLKKFNRIMSDYNFLIEDKNNYRKINAIFDCVGALSNKIEVLNITNEIFKLDLEVDNKLIYEKVQGKWNIEQLMRQSNQFVVSFNGYVRRKMDIASLRSEKFKDSILIFISLVQVLALVSIWNDYLALLNERRAPNYPDFIADSGSLEWVNAYGPTFLLAVVFVISVVFLIRRK